MINWWYFSWSSELCLDRSYFPFWGFGFPFCFCNFLRKLRVMVCRDHHKIRAHHHCQEPVIEIREDHPFCFLRALKYFLVHPVPSFIDTFARCTSAISDFHQSCHRRCSHWGSYPTFLFQLLVELSIWRLQTWKFCLLGHCFDPHWSLYVKANSSAHFLRYY